MPYLTTAAPQSEKSETSSIEQQIPSENRTTLTEVIDTVISSTLQVAIDFAHELSFLSPHIQDALTGLGRVMDIHELYTQIQRLQTEGHSLEVATVSAIVGTALTQSPTNFARTALVTEIATANIPRALVCAALYAVAQQQMPEATQNIEHFLAQSLEQLRENLTVDPQAQYEEAVMASFNQAIARKEREDSEIQQQISSILNRSSYSSSLQDVTASQLQEIIQCTELHRSLGNFFSSQIKILLTQSQVPAPLPKPVSHSALPHTAFIGISPERPNTIIQPSINNVNSSLSLFPLSENRSLENEWQCAVAENLSSARQLSSAISQKIAATKSLIQSQQPLPAPPRFSQRSHSSFWSSQPLKGYFSNQASRYLYHDGYLGFSLSEPPVPKRETVESSSSEGHSSSSDSCFYICSDGKCSRVCSASPNSCKPW